MIDPRDLTIKEFHEKLINKEFSAFEAAKSFYERIEEKDEEIGAYLNLTKETAFEAASEVDVSLAEGGEIGLLAGLPMAIKDNILIKNEPATVGSKMLENYRAPYEATAIKNLRAAKAVFLGKTNMDEFAMGSSTENSAFKVTRNPRDPERVPGGSSGGSAAAVSAHEAIAALGSDTGGSIRQPAGFTGTVGLKPTYGAVSRFGLIAMASSLDQIGPITKTVEDAAIVFKSIAGRDERDATSVGTDYGEDLISPKLEAVRKLTIGLPKEYFEGGLSDETESAVSEAINGLKSLKIKFKEISLPHSKYALSVYYIVMPAEVSANLARYDGLRYGKRSGGEAEDLVNLYLKNRTEGFGDEVKRRIILGTFVLSAGYYDAYYLKAQKVRALIRKDFTEAFKEVDVILTPVSPTVAFKLGERISDPMQMYLSDIFTIPANLAGLPAVSIPIKKTGLPVGFQLIGKPFREADILGLGQFYERLD